MTNPSLPAVVIGLDSITGLQTARILADRAVPVVGIVADRRHWGARTNSCVEILECELSGAALISALQRLGDRIGRTSVLMPCTDGSVDTLSRERDQLKDHFVLPLAPHEVRPSAHGQGELRPSRCDRGVAGPTDRDPRRPG